jgi:nitrite reductase/ring-hydroxylating ferredoxin subunit
VTEASWCGRHTPGRRRTRSEAGLVEAGARTDTAQSYPNAEGETFGDLRAQLRCHETAVRGAAKKGYVDGHRGRQSRMTDRLAGESRVAGESLTAAIENAEFLDRVGTPLSNAVRSVLDPGPLKDALSGTWLGHPLHPVLTDVVVGSFFSTSALDLLGGRSLEPARRRLVAVGLVAYAPTALSGASDWIDATSDTRVKRDGVVHAAANLVGSALYGASLPIGKRGRRATAVAMRTAGMGVLVLGAFLGGHLSFRRNVGPDQTFFDPGPSDWTSAVDASQLVEGRPQRAIVGDTPVLLLQRGDQIHAIHDRCSHRGCSLAEGEVEGDEIVCGCHFSRFSMSDGSVRRGPAVAPQPVFETRREGSIVQVRLR